MTNKAIGKQGESLAKEYLIKHGFKILTMNYKYSRLAEIDIIAAKDNIIHFVEVKTRSSSFFGSPFEAITPKKLSSIYSCALFYLKNNPIKYKKIQIDAIGIILNKDGSYKIDVIEDISL